MDIDPSRSALDYIVAIYRDHYIRFWKLHVKSIVVISLCIGRLAEVHIAYPSMHAMSGHVLTEADHSGNGMEDAEDSL